MAYDSTLEEMKGFPNQKKRNPPA